MVRTRPFSASANTTGDYWIELAWGRGTQLERFFGPAERADHFPGLGLLDGWAIDDGTRTVGGIFTGYWPRRDTVDFWLPPTIVDNKAFGHSSLDVLMGLPAECLSRLQILSFPADGAVMQLQDRGVVVVETTSRAAISKFRGLLVHLVAGADPTIVDATASQHGAIYLKRSDDGPIVGHRDRPCDDPSEHSNWQEIRDWA